jgi:hypothetical protein
MKVFFLLLLVGFSLTVKSQTSEFPKSWAGNWKGELQWYKTGNPEPKNVNMELIIRPADSTGNYSWQIIYGSPKEDSRPYILKAKDAAKGHWVIDELNGIVLDQYWIGEKLCGVFTVMGNTIVNNYRLENGMLLVEFYSFSARPVATTGNGTEDSPSVESYSIGSYQKAVLHREK